MTSSITESWIRIENWLSVHAPATFDALAPPAAFAEITAAEQAIGLALPDALKESLLRHDGTGRHDLLPPFWVLLSTHEIVECWRRKVGIHESSPCPDKEEGRAGDFGPWWHRQWIPFASDGCGDELVIDMRPIAQQGRIGEADKVHGSLFEPEVMWSCLPTLFETVATTLETGDVMGHSQRIVTAEGGLDWPPA